MLKMDADNGITYNGNNWAFKVKTLSNEIGLSYIWENQFNMLINISLIKQRITDIYTQQWYSSITNSRRLQSYSSYKCSFVFEKYLDYIKDKKYRIALTQLRTSSHKLAIETGRHRNQAINERLCTNCNLNQIESEYHFLLVCPKYRALRENYFTRYYLSWPSMNKFHAIMSQQSCKKLLKLSKYIFSACKFRNEN